MFPDDAVLVLLFTAVIKSVGNRHYPLLPIILSKLLNYGLFVT